MSTVITSTDTPETDAHVLETLHNGMMPDILGRFNLLLPFTRNLERQRNDALAALEREQIRLAACDVVAMSDTPESAAKARKMHPDYESAALESVKRRVDECIALRQMVRELRDALQMVNCIDLSPCNGGSCMVATDADDSLDCIKGKATQLITKANQLLP